MSHIYLNDLELNTRHWAKVGGIPCKEMISLKCDFCFAISFCLEVSDQEFFDYMSHFLSVFKKL
jgi:hypothetical protein